MGHSKSTHVQPPAGEVLPSKDLPPNLAPFFPNIFWKNQFGTKAVYPPAGTDLSGKTAIITGANSGLGLECSRQLLSYKLSRLIMAVRSQKKGEDAAAQLRLKYPKADIRVWQLDMSLYLSIQTFVKRVETELNQVDFVVQNAGLLKEFDIIPSTGHEELFQVNYLSQAFLTILLLPVLKSKSPVRSPAHVTWVNGALSLVGKVPDNKGPIFPALDNKETFNAQDAYNTSKVLAHFFLWKLSDYVSADDAIVTITDPGYVKGTQLGKEMIEKYGRWIVPFVKAFQSTGRTLENGTSTLVDSLVNHGKESHGCFIMGWKIAP